LSRAQALRPADEDLIWSLYLRKAPRREIATQVGTSVTTVRAAVKRVRRRLNDRRLADLEALRTEALAEYEHIQNEAWNRLQSCNPTSSVSVGYIGVILDARHQRDRVLGLELQRLDVTSGGKSIADLLKQYLNHPVEIIDVTPLKIELEDTEPL
jgi:hypothetical protein